MQCLCGHVITDRTDNLPYKAFLGPDEEPHTPASQVAGILAGYVEAREQGREAAFLREYETKRGMSDFWIEDSVKTLPQKSLAEALLHFLYSMWGGVSGRIVYECEECGRLHIESGDRYVTYAPETDQRHMLRTRYFLDGRGMGLQSGDGSQS